ncbi:MAG: transglycosylase [Prochlorococcaceae cyanobacterium]
MLATPQDPALLALFAPYCGGLARQKQLQRALAQLQLGQLAGERRLAQGEPHPFVLGWQPLLAPLDPCRCSLQFPRSPAVNYSFDVASYQLVAWLMEALESESPTQPPTQPPTLPESFWRWLLLGEGNVVQPA